jgi:hypothetical protein
MSSLLYFRKIQYGDIDRQREGGELREKGFSAAGSTFSGIVFALVPLVSRTNMLQISVKQSGKATFDGTPRCRP